jgi:hypothetical protein
MESALVVLAIVVVLVAIDVIGRPDEREPAPIQKILVDLTKRDRE